jgi:hypothetical protein
VPTSSKRALLVQADSVRGFVSGTQGKKLHLTVSSVRETMVNAAIRSRP